MCVLCFSHERSRPGQKRHVRASTDEGGQLKARVCRPIWHRSHLSSRADRASGASGFFLANRSQPFGSQVRAGALGCAPAWASPDGRCAPWRWRSWRPSSGSPAPQRIDKPGCGSGRSGEGKRPGATSPSSGLGLRLWPRRQPRLLEMRGVPRRGGAGHPPPGGAPKAGVPGSPAVRVDPYLGSERLAIPWRDASALGRPEPCAGSGLRALVRLLLRRLSPACLGACASMGGVGALCILQRAVTSAGARGGLRGLQPLGGSGGSGSAGAAGQWVTGGGGTRGGWAALRRPLEALRAQRRDRLLGAWRHAGRLGAPDRAAVLRTALRGGAVFQATVAHGIVAGLCPCCRGVDETLWVP